MDTIARACGLSKPTLYNYFHGKHEIFTELYQRLYRGLYDKIKVLLTRSPSLSPSFQGGDKKRGSGLTPSKPRHSCQEVEGLTLDKDKVQILQDVIDEYFAWLDAKKDFLRMYFREQHLVIHEDIDEHMAWHVRSKREMVGLLSQALEGIIRPELRKRFGVTIVASTILDIFEGLSANPNPPSAEDLLTQKAFLVELLHQGVLAGGR